METKTAADYCEEGDKHFKKYRDNDALLCYDKAIRIDSNDADYHRKKARTLLSLEKYREAICSCHEALQINPSHHKSYYVKGNALRKLGKYEEAILCYDQAIEINPDDADYHNNKGITLEKLGKYQEAILCYTKSFQINNDGPLYYCKRGKAYMALNKTQDALDDFKKAQEIIKSGQLSSTLSKRNIKYIDKTLKSIFELQKYDEMAEISFRNLDTNNPGVPTLVENFRAIQQDNYRMTINMLEQIEKKDDEMPPEIKHRYIQLQEDYQKLLKKMEEQSTKVERKIDNIQDQVDQLQVQVQEIQQSLDALKDEVDNKMDDFYRKLDKELESLDLPAKSKVKVKDYFKAFIGTFSSAFVASQVIESGRLNLNAKTSAGSLLSALATFSPFAGKSLSSGIASIDRFLSTKEMRTNARNMLGLFSDSAHLSAMIGKTAYEIVLDPTKRKKILSVTHKVLDKRSGDLIQHIRQFCRQMHEQVNIFLYTELYSTPSARLGHLDANKLIKFYFEGKISLYRAQEEFVERILNPKSVTSQEKKSASEKKGKKNEEGECNIF